MYAIESMIDMGLHGAIWTSDIHRTVAARISICNPNVVTMDSLMNNVKIVNNLSDKDVREVTFADLSRKGCVI